jgi:hypothetical protein
LVKRKRSINARNNNVKKHAIRNNIRNSAGIIAVRISIIVLAKSISEPSVSCKMRSNGSIIAWCKRT